MHITLFKSKKFFIGFYIERINRVKDLFWFNACCSVHLGYKGNYLFQLNVHFLMFLESFLLFAQHVLEITASIIRSTTVVYAAICFPVEDRSTVFSISSLGCFMFLCVRSESCVLVCVLFSVFCFSYRHFLCLLYFYLRFWCVYSVRLVLVFCHITVSRSVIDWLVSKR
jgi:hypothetical protein